MGWNTVQPDELLPSVSTAADTVPLVDDAPLIESDRNNDALLRLLNNCVTAMHILDTRMSDLENKARRALEESARERSESRADIATLRTRTKLTDSAADQIQARLSACEVGAAESSDRHAREIAAARADVETWRLRTETSIGKLGIMEERLSQVETSLERRLRTTESDLTLARHQAARMEQRAVVSEAAAAGLEGRLLEAVSAVSEQRARIACLQAKLGVTAQTSRYVEDMAALTAPPQEKTVFDLADHVEDRRVSAA
jgi:hypothetical protein